MAVKKELVNANVSIDRALAVYDEGRNSSTVIVAKYMDIMYRAMSNVCEPQPESRGCSCTCSWSAGITCSVGVAGCAVLCAGTLGAGCFDGYSCDLGIEFQFPVLTWGRSEGDIFEC